MHYKTLALGLIQSRPPLYRHLKATRRLLAALEGYAADLRADHLSRIDLLAAANPNLDPPSRSAAALELALSSLEGRVSADASRAAPDH